MSDPLQDRHLPGNACFGCGPDNPEGFQIKSYPADGGGLVAELVIDERFQGPSGIVNGGLLAVPMDCHSTWTAMVAFTDNAGSDELVHAVTANYRMRLRRPTPVGVAVRLRSFPGWLDGRRTSVRTTATVDGDVTAEFDGVFAVVEGRYAST